MIEVIKRDGTPVRNLQNMLRTISLYYSNIPLIAVDGIFGPSTTNAVKEFQKVYKLPVTGEVDIITFEEIVRITNIINTDLKKETL